MNAGVSQNRTGLQGFDLEILRSGIPAGLSGRFAFNVLQELKNELAAEPRRAPPSPLQLQVWMLVQLAHQLLLCGLLDLLPAETRDPRQAVSADSGLSSTEMQ